MRIFPIRFVVLCHARTGSTLLGSLLAAHPQIAWGGEYYKRIKVHARTSVRRQLLRIVVQRVPLLYLNWQALCDHRPTYGCKLMPGYVRDIVSVIPHLYHNGWRIIHLQRRDVFRVALSSTVAFSARHYITDTGTQSPAAPKLYVDPVTFLTKLRTCVQMDAIEQHSLTGVPHLKIVYEEDLVKAACWPSTTARVFEYLGVPTIPVQSSVGKTWDRPYQEIIANYAELVAAISGSELAHVLPLASPLQQIEQDQERVEPAC